MTQQKASTSLPQNDLPFTAEEWAQTPERVQLFVVSLLHRVEPLESSVTELQEQVKRNSQNSSQPPSSDGLDQDAPKGQPGKRAERGAAKLVIRNMSVRCSQSNKSKKS